METKTIYINKQMVPYFEKACAELLIKPENVINKGEASEKDIINFDTSNYVMFEVHGVSPNILFNLGILTNSNFYDTEMKRIIESKRK